MSARKYFSVLLFILLILLPALTAISLTGSAEPKAEGTELWAEVRSSTANSKSPVSGQIAGGAKSGGKARVAIVIDDFGQRNATGVKEILSLDIPITCAVMPNLKNTLAHTEEAARKGHQVIVHLPLEPVNGKKSWLGPGAITTKLTEDEIKSLARKDFDSVPHAVGFNNHMGSAATSSDKVMRSILQVAKERNFFVLDSKTTDKSRIPELSRELGIPCVKRDVFLDNVKSLKYIKKQLSELSREALKNGKAIGIGHVGQGGKVTAQALKEMIPGMKEAGIEFMYLSEIVETKQTH